MRRTVSSGSHASDHVSRNVPLLPRPSVTVPHGTPRARRRWSSTDLARPVGVRTSTSTVRRPGSGLSRARRCWTARSRASGTCGASSGTMPIASPTISSSWISAMPEPPAASTASAASSTSARPGPGRPRSTASAPAARVAAIRWSGDAGRSWRRSSRAASTNQRATPASPGLAKTCAYQPGLCTPAAYPGAPSTPAADRRRWVHGTQLTPTFTFGRARRARASAAALGIVSRVAPGVTATPAATWAVARPARAGTCHAPQTTAIRAKPSATAWRMHRRMCASRRSSATDGGGAPDRTAAIAAATASNAGGPSPRCSTTSSHQRSGSGSPAASASAASGSTGRPGPAANRLSPS
ncbi:MAG: hypothetical protein QM733_10200 [Ilumatobacteraceae bacterium]